MFDVVAGWLIWFVWIHFNWILLLAYLAMIVFSRLAWVLDLAVLNWILFGLLSGAVLWFCLVY